MIIKRSTELENKIIQTVKDNWVNKIRTDVALTDLIYPRQAYFKRKYPKELELREILDFLRGKSIEVGLGDLLKMSHPQAKINHGIWYNPDFRMPEDSGFPEITELKSRRSYLAKDGEEIDKYGYYIKQHKGYCALEGHNIGNLIIFSLAEKADDGYRTEPKLVAYTMEYTDEELNEYLELLIDIKDRFLKTLEDDDFTRLPECETFNCGVTLKTLNEKAKCECGKEWSSDKFAFMHRSKTKHNVKLCKYDYKFESRCKWIDICNPEVYRKINDKN